MIKLLVAERGVDTGEVLLLAGSLVSLSPEAEKSLVESGKAVYADESVPGTDISPVEVKRRKRKEVD